MLGEVLPGSSTVVSGALAGFGASHSFSGLGPELGASQFAEGRQPGCMSAERTEIAASACGSKQWL